MSLLSGLFSGLGYYLLDDGTSRVFHHQLCLSIVPLKSGSPVSPSLTTTGRAFRPLFEEYHFSAILGLGCFIETCPGVNRCTVVGTRSIGYIKEERRRGGPDSFRDSSRLTFSSR